MEKQAQNIQEAFLNNARKDKTFLTIYLMSGVKLSGRIKSFDKYSVVLETNSQEQLIFKHAISTVVVSRPYHYCAPKHRCDRRHACRSGRPGRRRAPLDTPLSASQEVAILVGLNLTGRGTQRKSAGGETGQASAEDSLAELASLAATAGVLVGESQIQSRARVDSATQIGSGKVEELKALIHLHEADVVIFDRELTPTQQRNLERALDVKVLDRTQLILDIFARRARTREGQLQVELAQLNYLLPRLTGHGAAMSRLGAGIGSRGPGETKLETDRRRIHQRIHAIERGSGAGARRTRDAAPAAPGRAARDHRAGGLHQRRQIVAL